MVCICARSSEKLRLPLLTARMFFQRTDVSNTLNNSAADSKTRSPSEMFATQTSVVGGRITLSARAHKDVGQSRQTAGHGLVASKENQVMNEIEMHGLAVSVLWASFALATVFGAIAQRTHFCTMGAVADVVNMG